MAPVQSRLAARFPLALLLLLAALTWWLDQRVQGPLATQDGSQRHDPDYIVDNFAATSLGENGKPEHVLFAKRMAHFPDDDSTELTAPRYTNFQEGQPPVTVTSDRASLSSKGEDVYFTDNVVVTRAAHGKRPPVVMTTTWLHVIRDQRIAETDRPVVIREANSTVHAVGLQLDAEARVLKLSKVRATYYLRR